MVLLTLKKDDVVLVTAGEIIPGDGEIIEGIASVDESVVTGESAPVIREIGWRQKFGNRRHKSPFGPDKNPDNCQSW